MRLLLEVIVRVLIVNYGLRSKMQDSQQMRIKQNLMHYLMLARQ